MNMKITKILLLTFFIVKASFLVLADEGMWIPMLLNKYNIEDMQKKGFKLTAEDIYSINKASMKDAVMLFGRGCTGELISEQGLLITNHHCGYGAIQSHSSVEHDYLTNGFWADSKENELDNPGLTVTFLVRMEDVTESVLKGITEDLPEIEKQKIIQENIEKIKAEAIKGTIYQAVLKPFFNGNAYYLFINKVYTDIRLVGAPPSAIGKFGGDTDNWMWPRHTGDFSLFRIYADKNNEPAKYSKDNVPFTPLSHFPISLKGFKKDDFTMVFGYPGRTQEYLSSYAVKNIMDIINPNRIKIRDTKLALMKADMETSPKIRIQYSAKAAHVSNSWKKWIGENRGLKKLDAINKKQDFEKQLTEWINADDNRKVKFGNILPTYKKLYKTKEPLDFVEQYMFEAIWGIETINYAWKFNRLEELEGDKQTELIEKIKKGIAGHFKNYNQPTDKKIFAALYKIYADSVSDDYQLDLVKLVNKKYKGDFLKYANKIYAKSIFTDEKRLNSFLNNFSLKKLQADPLYASAVNLINIYRTKIAATSQAINLQITDLDKKYMKAIMEYKKGQNLYPNANLTLRIAYGKVNTYEPRDGVIYKYFTTLDGIIAKDNPEIYDYDVPEKLKELYKNKDYGQYADADGTIHTCFIATNHTTGGNSGSPVINANGELIGVNFDRNWEGTMSDIMYDPDQCRNISLDIRYALFLIDKYAGSTRLIDEMTLVK